MKLKRLRKLLAAATTLSVILLSAALGQQRSTTPEGTPDKEDAARAFPKPGYSPYAGRNYPTRVLFGDTHLHTSISMDARSFGCTLGPEEAYRFARGQEMVSATGQRAKLARPLDFLVVADHAEVFGAINEIVKGNPQLMSDPTLKRWHDMLKEGGNSGYKAALEIISALTANKIPEAMTDPKVTRAVWREYVATAEKYNEPGRFTSFIGYEWTSTKNGNNLHRVVMFRDGAAIRERDEHPPRIFGTASRWCVKFG
jgi:hypothetical protein